MTSALLAAIAVISVGVLVLWSNPGNVVNRVVFTCSLHIALWLGAMHRTVTAADGLLWLRWTTAIAALIPLHFWVVKEAIASDLFVRGARRLFELALWTLIASMLAGLCFTDFFIPSHSTADNRLFGPGYYIYIVGSIILYAALAADTLRKIRRLSGGRRLALQVWLWGGCAAALTILVLMVLNAAVGLEVRLQPFVVLLYYAGTAIAITTHRVFDARQLFLIGLSGVLLVVSVSVFGFAIFYILERLVPNWLAILGTAAAALWLSTIITRRLDAVFALYPEATAARQAVLSVARRESRVDNLVVGMESVLRGWGQTEKAILLLGGKEQLTGSGLTVDGNSAILIAIRSLRWASPERLSRERSTSEREALEEFLRLNELGLVAFQDGPALSVLVGVGIPASRRPYTYPQVTQLMELASIMESALERAHFSAKVQHTEQLATVGLLGASLAHEIRNPLVSIKTFVQLLPTHYHDPRFREKFFKLIGDEVGRIDGLTEQLLDLATPRTYAATTVELHPLLRASLDLVAAKAAHRKVQLQTDFAANPDRAFTDASAAKQVMLNLCFNAIQAVEAKADGDRWIRIATRNVGRGLEMAVSDNGPGIAPEMRPKLFQPFQTTKSSGFGLGLAICSDILANLDATISVDPHEPGRGATFRVIFPCQPSSS